MNVTTTPKQVESIPAVTAPVVLPDLRAARASFIANVIVGGLLAVADGVLLVWAVTL